MQQVLNLSLVARLHTPGGKPAGSAGAAAGVDLVSRWAGSKGIRGLDDDIVDRH